MRHGSKRLRGTSLTTMWTEVNFFEKSRTSIDFLDWFGRTPIQQNGPYEVIGTSRGTTFGNFLVMKRGRNDGQATVSCAEGRTRPCWEPDPDGEWRVGLFARDLVEVSGDPGTIKFKMWGVKATGDHPRTIDTADTYTLMSSRRPLVGGWEPIGDYFKRMTEQAAKKGGKFQPPGARGTRESLRRFCEDVPIPRAARRA